MQVEDIFIWGKKERKTGKFRYSMTITNSPQVTANQNAGFALVHLLGDTKKAIDHEFFSCSTNIPSGLSAFSKFSAPTIAFVAFRLAKKLRL